MKNILFVLAIKISCFVNHVPNLKLMQLLIILIIDYHSPIVTCWYALMNVQETTL